jgi:hypothetical protein
VNTRALSLLHISAPIADDQLQERQERLAANTRGQSALCSP